MNSNHQVPVVIRVSLYQVLTDTDGEASFKQEDQLPSGLSHCVAEKMVKKNNKIPGSSTLLKKSDFARLQVQAY